MEILNVTYKCKAGMREKFLDAIKAALVDYYTRSGREMPESLVGFEPHED